MHQAVVIVHPGVVTVLKCILHIARPVPSQRCVILNAHVLTNAAAPFMEAVSRYIVIIKVIDTGIEAPPLGSGDRINALIILCGKLGSDRTGIAGDNGLEALAGFINFPCHRRDDGDLQVYLLIIRSVHGTCHMKGGQRLLVTFFANEYLTFKKGNFSGMYVLLFSPGHPLQRFV